MGGENRAAGVSAGVVVGSSPRGRGKRIELSREHEVGGLIPAWAGKTKRPTPQLKLSRAHPRVGGENHPANAIRNLQMGSSPRGRGKLWTVKTKNLDLRLIPAWAGKTRARRGG